MPPSKKICLVCHSTANIIPKMSDNIKRIIEKGTKFKNVKHDDCICSSCLKIVQDKLRVLRDRKQSKSNSLSSDSSKDTLSQPVVPTRKRRIDDLENESFIQSESSISNIMSQPSPKKRLINSNNNRSMSSSSSSNDFLQASLAPVQRNVRINNTDDLIGFRRTTGG